MILGGGGSWMGKRMEGIENKRQGRCQKKGVFKGAKVRAVKLFSFEIHGEKASERDGSRCAPAVLVMQRPRARQPQQTIRRTKPTPCVDGMGRDRSFLIECPGSTLVLGWNRKVQRGCSRARTGRENKAGAGSTEPARARTNDGSLYERLDGEDGGHWGGRALTSPLCLAWCRGYGV